MTEVKKTATISREQMEQQISEMWDAVSGISGEDSHAAIEQAYLVEDKLRKDFDDQERLRDAAPELLKACESVMRLKYLISYEVISEENEGEASAVNSALSEIEAAIKRARGL